MKRWPTRVLGEVVVVSPERIQPTEHPTTLFNYVGLENIEGHTGRLLPYLPTRGIDIKSTKNVFQPGDILYGKLRPYLNKAHLACREGICSTDIYVLRPQRQLVNPSFLVNYLRSPSVLAIVSSAMAGANLPRIASGGLLSIQVPLPPIWEQERIVRLLDEADELRKLRAQADRHTATLIPALFHEMFGDHVIRSRGWPVRPLSAFIREGPQNGLYKHSSFYGEGTPILRIDAFYDGEVTDLAKLKRLSPDGRREKRTCQPRRHPVGQWLTVPRVRPLSSFEDCRGTG